MFTHKYFQVYDMQLRKCLLPISAPMALQYLHHLLLMASNTPLHAFNSSPFKPHPGKGDQQQQLTAKQNQPELLKSGVKNILRLILFLCSVLPGRPTVACLCANFSANGEAKSLNKQPSCLYRGMGPAPAWAKSATADYSDSS